MRGLLHLTHSVYVFHHGSNEKHSDPVKKTGRVARTVESAQKGILRYACTDSAVCATDFIIYLQPLRHSLYCAKSRKWAKCRFGTARARNLVRNAENLV